MAEPEDIIQPIQETIPVDEQWDAPWPDPALDPPDHPTPAWEQSVETWFNDLRVNLQHLDTETHNALHAAKEALKARLRGLIA